MTLNTDKNEWNTVWNSFKQQTDDSNVIFVLCPICPHMLTVADIIRQIMKDTNQSIRLQQLFHHAVCRHHHHPPPHHHYQWVILEAGVGGGQEPFPSQGGSQLWGNIKSFPPAVPKVRKMIKMVFGKHYYSAPFSKSTAFGALRTQLCTSTNTLKFPSWIHKRTKTKKVFLECDWINQSYLQSHLITLHWLLSRW